MSAAEETPHPRGVPPQHDPDAPVTLSLYEKWQKIHPLWVSGGWQTARRVVLVILLLVFYLSSCSRGRF